MADYTQLTWKVLEQLLGAYDLGELESIAPLDGGQANSSMKIKTRTGVFTLSVCDEKNQSQVQCLTRVLVYLEAHGFPTPRLVRTRDGLSFIEYGGKPVYIKEFIPGQVSPFLAPDMIFQAGQAMARLHALPPPPGLPQNFPYGLKAFDEILGAKISHPYKNWLQEKKAFLAETIDPDMARGFVHGDIFWDNLIFSGPVLTALLDFEEACTYYKLFDLGMAAVGCCSTSGVFDLDKIKQLTAGYQSLCPLTETEKKQYKIFMEYAAVASSFWRFRQYNIRYPLPDKKDNHRELSSLADQVHAMEESLFLENFIA